MLAAGLVAGGAAVAAALAGRDREAGTLQSRDKGPVTVGGRETDGPGRLSARPRAVEVSAPEPGTYPLRLAGGRDGLLYVPSTYREGVPAPLVVSLHGAGGNAEGGLAPLRQFADAAGLVLVAPESRGRTWDVIEDDYGADVAFIDRTLDAVFQRLRLDTGRLAIGGFSDGASYALSLGLANGDLFTHCIAFSPGFHAAPSRQGRIRVFIAHGVHDAVLPIDRCSRRIVPALRREGYDVDYREFDGPHTVPLDQAEAAVAWLTGS